MKSQRGATILEALVGLTILFIGLTVALGAQAVIERKLGTRDIHNATMLADSLMVVVSQDERIIDSTWTAKFPSVHLNAKVSVKPVNSVRQVRLEVWRDDPDTPLQQLYYETPIYEKS